MAFDASPYLNVRTGVGRYARELAAHLELLGVELKPYAVALRGRKEEGVARWRVPARGVQESWRRFGKPAITRLTGAVDVVHATNFVLPALGGTPGVVTVHDLSFTRTDVFPGGERLEALVPWSIARAARTIVPTEAVGAELVERYRVDPAGVVAIHEGVAPVFFGAAPLSDATLAAMGVHRPFVLAAGTIEPRKNLPLLLEAWSRAGLDGWMLVLAGPRGWGPRLPETAGVLPVGWIGDETLPGLLAAAEIFCYPSLYEGFGLPPLEAMAAGTPVVAGRYPAAPEVLADAALLITPRAGESIAEALSTLANDDDLRARLARAGKARAATFTWEKTAAATLKTYLAAVEAPT